MVLAKIDLGSGPHATITDGYIMAIIDSCVVAAKLECPNDVIGVINKKTAPRSGAVWGSAGAICLVVVREWERAERKLATAVVVAMITVSFVWEAGPA